MILFLSSDVDLQVSVVADVVISSFTSPTIRRIELPSVSTTNLTSYVFLPRVHDLLVVGVVEEFFARPRRVLHFWDVELFEFEDDPLQILVVLHTVNVVSTDH